MSALFIALISLLASSSSLKLNGMEEVQLPQADILIVGAGISGAVLAHLHKEVLNQTSVVIDKRNHIAGNMYDFKNEFGFLESLYGPHFFHTKFPRVWHYMYQFSKFVPYEHRVVSLVDTDHGDALVPVPVNIDSVNSIASSEKPISTADEMTKWLKSVQVHNDSPQNSEEVGLARVGEKLYEALFKPYTIKQWGREPRELDASVLARIDVRGDFDDRYFPNDEYQALPAEGYTKMVERIFDREGVSVTLNTDFFQLNDKTKSQYKKIYFCGPVDQFFEKSGLGKLAYRSLTFEREQSLKDAYIQTSAQQNYPSSKYPFTRITEYKHIMNSVDAKGTVWLKETSADNGEPYYPVPDPKNQALYEKYKALAAAAETESNPPTFFVGRLANYKYYNMDQAILNAIEQFERINPGIKKETIEKMYGGISEERALSFFHADPAHPAFTFVIHQDCNIDIDSLNHALSSICPIANKKWTQAKLFRSCDSATSWTATHSKAQQELTHLCGGDLFRVDDVETQPNTTANKAFLTHLLSSTGANAVTDLNVFLSGKLDFKNKVHDKVQTAVQSVMASVGKTGYAARKHRAFEVRGAGHFAHIPTADPSLEFSKVQGLMEKEIDQCKKILGASKVGEQIPEEMCSQLDRSIEPMSAFVVTDAALRRTAARHRTLLWNTLKSDNVDHQYTSRLLRILIDGHKKQLQSNSLIQMDSSIDDSTEPSSSDEGNWMQWAGLG